MIKHKADKVRSSGTSTSVDRAIYESIIDFLSVSYWSSVGTSLSSIAATLTIEVEELYDYYTNYFDVDPDYPVQSGQYDRDSKITSNTNIIEADIFLDFDAALKEQIFNVNVFLTELGQNFTINYNLDSVDLNCKSGDKLYDLITAEKDSATEIVKLRKKLLEKYVGTDFFYISTGNTTDGLLYGKLIEAVNPTGNLLNRHTPSTATIPVSTQLKALRDIGLSFKPDKMGLLYFSVPEKKYKIDKTKLKANTVYVFPDPNRYGNTTVLTDRVYEYPLIQIENYTNSSNNPSMFYAEGDIFASPYTQSFYGYISKNQLNNTIQYGVSGITDNFAALYNRGIITEWKMDIYGNEYGIFRAKPPKVNHVTEIIEPTEIVFDGYEFHDDEELYNFNYSTVEDFGNNTYRTGLTANTVDAYSVSASFVMASTPYYLFFRSFLPYEHSEPTYEYNLYDAAKFTFNNNSLLPQQYSSDISQWPGTSTLYYYNLLIDGGIGSITPFSRALSGVNSLSANFGFAYQTNSDSYSNIDCGKFTDEVQITNVKDSTDYYVDTVMPYAVTTYAVSSVDPELSSEQINELNGTMFFRDVLTCNIQPASAALANIYDKYSAAVTQELNYNVQNINIWNEYVFFTTNNYFVIDKLIYTDVLEKPNTSNVVLTINQNSYNRLSEPYFIPNADYCLFVATTAINTNSNNVVIYPIIYKYRFDNNTLSEMYPRQTSVSATYVNTLSTHIVNVRQPVLAYNSRNNIWSINWVIEDNNKLPYFAVTKLAVTDTVTIKSYDLYSASNYMQTTNLVDNSFSSYRLLSGGTVSKLTISNGYISI